MKKVPTLKHDKSELAMALPKNLTYILLKKNNFNYIFFVIKIHVRVQKIFIIDSHSYFPFN